MKTLISVLSVILSLNSIAQNVDWVQQSPPVTTQSLQDVAILSPGVLVVVGESGTIIKSSDGGETWAKKTSPTSSSLYSVNFITPTVGFACGNSGTILKTSDGGESWVTQTSNTWSTLYSIDFVSPDTGWVSGYNRTILKTTDGGTNWVSQYSTSILTWLEDMDVINQQKAVAVGWGSTGDFYKTTDGGLIWTGADMAGWAKGVDFINDSTGWVAGITASYISVTDDGWGGIYTTINGKKATIWKTTNNGGTWTPYIFNPAQWLYDISAISSNKIFAVGEKGLVLYTTDGGTNWVNYNNLQFSSTSFFSVQFESSATGYIVGDNGTILKTTDGGITWNPLGHGGTTSSLNSIDFVNDSTGWAVGYNGKILKTTNKGNYWMTQNIGTTNVSFMSVYFVNSNTGWAAGADGKIYKTINGGLNWVIQTSGTTNTLYSLYFVNENKGWVTGSNGTILYSSNGGTTWVPQTSGCTDWLETVFFTDSINGWTGGSGKILKTTNGGTTWQSLNINIANNCNDLFFFDKDTGWFIGNAIFKTIDGGINWTKQLDMDYYNYGSLTAISFINSQVGWISSGNGKVLKTINGGATWGLQETGFKSNLYDICFINSSSGWVVGYGGLILNSSTGGGNVIPMVQVGVPALISPENYKDSVKANTVLKWSYEGTKLNYQVKVLSSSGDTVVLITTVADSMQLNNLQPGTYYRWSVRVINKDGIPGNWSSIFYFYTCHPPYNYLYLSYPYKYSYQVNNLYLTLEWSGASGVDRFQVQVSKGSDFSNIFIDTFVYTGSVVVKLDYESTYIWRVAPVNFCGSGTWKEKESFTTRVKPFVNVTTPYKYNQWLTGSSGKAIYWLTNAYDAKVILLYKGEVITDTIGYTDRNNYSSSFKWNIPTSISPGTDYRIMVKDTLYNCSGFSEYFSIVNPIITIINPTVATTWRRGSAQNRIDWYDNIPNSLLIMLYKAGIKYDSLGFAPSINFYWDIPGSLPQGSDYQIAVKDTITNTIGFSPDIIITWATTIDNNADIMGSVSIYPNPANDILNLEVDRLSPKGAEIKLFDLAGQCLMDKKLLSSKIEINIEAFPRGIYMVEIKNGDFKYNKKLVLK